MNKSDYIRLRNLDLKDTVTINALELQRFITESYSKDLAIQNLKNENAAMAKDNKVLEAKLVKVLDRNDELHKMVTDQSSEITEFRKVIESTTNKLSKALDKVKGIEKLKDKLSIHQALFEYRKNQSVLTAIEKPLTVNLYQR